MAAEEEEENEIPHPILNHNVNGCVVRFVGTEKNQLGILRLIDMEWNSHAYMAYMCDGIMHNVKNAKIIKILNRRTREESTEKMK